MKSFSSPWSSFTPHPLRLALRARRRLAVAVVAVATLSTLSTLSACGSGSDTEAGAPADAPSPTEAAGPQPRLAISYDGGVLVLDAESGEVLHEEELDGYVRLNPAGDDRHVLVSRSGGFTALDLGSWTEAHGDHGHSWTLPPSLTAFEVEAGEPGHVVAHQGRTTLFDDATGTATAFDPADLADVSDAAAPETHRWTADQAHHGVAYQEGHGTMVTTVGDETTRSGIEVTTRSGTTVARTDQCPGLHGEAFAGDAAVFGCEDGAIVLDRLTISKVKAPDVYGRIGNQAGHDSSPFVLGDYKVEPDAELERPTRVAAIDTQNASLDLIELPASYSFRSLGRTPDGDGLVLGTDGKLHRIDLAAGRVTGSTAVVEAWKEPIEWQQPRPALNVVGDRAYVTEPAADRIHVVDLASGTVADTFELPVTPDEVVGVTG